MDIRRAVGVKAGVPPDKLAALTAYRNSPHFTEREKVALEFSEQLTRDDQEVSDECFGRLRQHFSEPEIVELTFIIGYQTFASTFAKAFRLAPQGFASPGGSQGARPEVHEALRSSSSPRIGTSPTPTPKKGGPGKLSTGPVAPRFLLPITLRAKGSVLAPLARLSESVQAGLTQTQNVRMIEASA